MEIPLLIISAIVSIGLLFVLLPTACKVYQRFRDRKVVICPHTDQIAEVMPKAWHAAFMATFGRKSMPRVKWCSLWPKRKGCDEKCMEENWPPIEGGHGND